MVCCRKVVNMLKSQFSKEDIRNLRESLAMSQEEFAEFLRDFEGMEKVSQTTIWRWESGNSSP
ncbi:MAG: helix-turn-helix transcriptional regulator, partial [Bdellovibrionales bacterium]|nr:helix-turn-helix transcriptional regulator [Bdellovibrionales bacterium]